MAKLSDYKPDTRLFALFVGQAGSGKSAAAISLPTKMKLYDFDLNAVSSAFGTPWISSEYKEGVDVTSYPPHKSIDEFVNDLNQAEMQMSMAAGKKDRYPFQTLVIDSLTAVSRVLMNDAYKTIGGRSIGQGKLKIRMPGPADWNYKDQAIYQIFDFLRSLPVNVIVSAHLVPRFGKPLSEKWIESEGKEGKDPEEDFMDKLEVGEKLSLTDKLSANILALFTECYRFERQIQDNGANKFYVRFRGDLARTSHPGLPDRDVDITGKNFYEYWLSKIKEVPK